MVSGVRRFSFLAEKRQLFETREHVLPEHGGENIFDLAGEQGDLHLGIGLLREQVIEDQHLAKDRGGFGGGERRVVIEIILLATQAAVQAVTELVSNRHDVAQVIVIIAENVRMQLR